MNIKINDDKNQEQRIKQAQETNLDLLESANNQPVNPGRTPANLTGAGSGDSGSLNTSSPVGLDTNLTASPDDTSATLDTNNRTGLAGSDRVAVGSNQQLTNNTASPNANNPMKTGTEQAEGGGFGNSAADMGNTNNATPNQ